MAPTQWDMQPKSPDVARRGPSATERLWLDDEAAYRHWREKKLSQYEAAVNELMTPVADLAAPTDAERAAIMERMEKTNMALYTSPAGTQDDDVADALLLGLGHAFGLRALEDHRSANRNGVVRIEIVGDGGRAGYIPYTDRPISWHTDGYYNFQGTGRCVQAMILHCGRAAAEGGVNRVLDHEIAWLRLRDRDPDALRLLMHPQAMTIPESVESQRPGEAGKCRARLLCDVGRRGSRKPSRHALFGAEKIHLLSRRRHQGGRRPAARPDRIGASGAQRPPAGRTRPDLQQCAA